jgi:hypothetical protein
MVSRDIWSTGSGPRHFRDLLGSALILLLLADDMEQIAKPAYFSSPWMSDFPLLDNSYRQFVSLFPDFAEHEEIWFTQYLRRLRGQRPVRIITTRSGVSRDFLAKLTRDREIECRFAEEEYHEKGILASPIYFEGSMNITYSGIYLRSEKISYHVADDPPTKSKVALAYLEFDRRWENLATSV